MRVRVVAYNGFLIMCPTNVEEKDEEWVPTENGRTMGCVLLDSKKNLGVSDEALELMRQVPVGRDAIGDIDWWAVIDPKGGEEKFAFSWFGSIFRIIHAESSESARGFRPRRSHCTIIPNDVPPEAKALIDSEGVDAFSWNQPDAVAAGTQTKRKKNAKPS
jgi:hypothetical protein